MALSVFSTSRFKTTATVLTEDGQETFGRLTKYPFLDPEILGDNFTTFEVDSTTAHRPDLIADSYYGNANLFWVVILFNRPKNPMLWPPNGSVIKLPTRSAIRPIL